MGKGKAEGCAACAKWLLIIFNVLFCLIGAGLIGGGVYAYVRLGEYLDFFGNPKLNATGIVLIVFGAITFIIAAIGCIGACKESPCLLFTFAAIIGILVLAELIAGIVAFVLRNDLEAAVRNRAVVLMKEYNETDATTFDVSGKGKEGEGTALTWDFVQHNLKCCGVNGSDDWTNPGLAPIQYSRGIPMSCKDKDGQVFKDGCVDAAIKFGKENILIIGGIGVGFAVAQLLGIILACCVGCAARKGEYA